MFIRNIKINKSLLFRGIIIGIIIIALLILVLSISHFHQKNKQMINDCLPQSSVTNISAKQYTNILKEVYENIDNYVGQTIHFTGYIYKLYDFKDSEFILARDMLINSDSQTVVVGFLCSYDKAKTFAEGTWVNVTGTIIKGYYHNEIPVIDITSMEETKKPEEIYVYPPDETYIPTSLIL